MTAILEHISWFVILIVCINILLIIPYINYKRISKSELRKYNDTHRYPYENEYHIVIYSSLYLLPITIVSIIINFNYYNNSKILSNTYGLTMDECYTLSIGAREYLFKKIEENKINEINNKLEKLGLKLFMEGKEK